MYKLHFVAYQNLEPKNNEGFALLIAATTLAIYNLYRIITLLFLKPSVFPNDLMTKQAPASVVRVKEEAMEVEDNSKKSIVSQGMSHVPVFMLLNIDCRTRFR